LTGPNQRWCWDISYLMTGQKGEYLYLYLLLDEWSRKAIQWASPGTRPLRNPGSCWRAAWRIKTSWISPRTTAEVINDRGRQMKAKPISVCVKITACPSCLPAPAPNDNPFIESAFSTVKRARRILDAFSMMPRPTNIQSLLYLV